MPRRHPGLLLIAACLAALALRVLVPAGWMPAEGRSGLVLALCSGGSMAVDAGDPLLPGEDDPICEYALASGPLLLVAALLPPLLALPLLQPALPRPAPVASRRHRVRPPGQGPPRA